MEKHFVHILSPGTFLSEENTYEIDRWGDVQKALELARTVKQRYGARPYGFCFSTRRREIDDFDSKVSQRSGMYYIGGTIETYEEVMARNDPDEEILRSNMKSNGYKRIVVNRNSYKFTAPLHEGDMVLDVSLDAPITGETNDQEGKENQDGKTAKGSVHQASEVRE